MRGLITGEKRLGQVEQWDHGPAQLGEGEPLKPQAFSSRGVDAGLKHWREAYGDSFARLYEVEGDAIGFYGRRDFVPLRTMAVGRYAFSEMTYRRTAERVRAAPSDQLVLQFNSVGGGVGDYGGGGFSMGPGDVAVFDLARVGGHRTEADNAGMMVALSRDVVGVPVTRSGDPLIMKGRRARLLTGFSAWLLTSMPRANVDDIAAAERAAAAVITACLDPGGPDPEMGEAGEAVGPMALSRALAFIRDHYAEPIGVEEVAAAAIVSRATLYRLFKPLGGVAEQIWQARLEKARAMLSDPTRAGTLSSIAEACGFTTSQHFSQRFRDAFGFSPRNLRPF